MARKRAPARPARPGPSYDPDLPVAGCYEIKLVKGGPPVALRIWYGPPLDPETRLEMDRAPRWNAMLNGVQVVAVERFWPECARQPISAARHDFITLESITQDPASPFYDPLKPIDRLAVPFRWES